MSMDDSGLVNPYVGARWFGLEPGDEFLFFGRDRERSDLSNLLIAQRIVLMHAPSGAGKTSLIQVALVPELLARGYAVQPIIRVGEELPTSVAGHQPNRYLWNTLARLQMAGETKADTPEGLGRSLEKELRRISESARASTPSGGQSSSTPLEDKKDPTAGLAVVIPEFVARPKVVLIFDQFEEILTQDSIDVEAKEEFFTWIGHALTSTDRLALFAMREDHVASMEPYVGRVPTRLRTRYRLDLLDKVAALNAIEEPVKVRREPLRFVSAEFDPKASEYLVDELRKVRLQRRGGGLGEEAIVDEPLGLNVEPVQLQIVCERFWRLWRAEKPNAKSITLEDVRKHGRVQEALSGYCDEKFAAIAEGNQGIERQVRDWVARWLITPQKVRSMLLKRYPATEGLDNAVTDRLIKHYIVREESRRGEFWFELVHDRLIESILESNERWYRKALSPLQRRAAEWERSGQLSRHLLGRRELAKEESQTEKADLTPIEVKFLNASRAARDQEDQLRILSSRPRSEALGEVGWGIIFARDVDPAVREALRPLLEHRRRQAGRHIPRRYREFVEGTAFQPEDTKWTFLARNGAGLGRAEPEVIPLYLLIVGDPETIPFTFQYHLDLQYAVGRLDFDTPDEYANYARNVVKAERQDPEKAPRAVFFAAQPPQDRASKLLVEELIRPLAQRLGDSQEDWTIDLMLGKDATKEQLRRLLGGDKAPDLIFVAGHGLSFPPDDPIQVETQGAIVCHDWPGPMRWNGPLESGFYLGSRDIEENPELRGSIVFLLNGFSGGTPRLDDFPDNPLEPAPAIAPRSFTAALPRRLLGSPAGGPLAVIGHVDQIWSTSFMSQRGEKDLGLFQSTLRRLMEGYRVGLAMDSFNARYAEQSAMLATEIEAHPELGLGDPSLFTHLTATKDARNYIVLGDPAVRLNR